MTMLITSLDEDPSGQLGLSVGCVWRGGRGGAGRVTAVMSCEIN